MAEIGDSYPLEKRWHVSRGIPLGLIFTLIGCFLLQTGTALWFFAHQDSRLEAVEKVQAVAATLADKLQTSTSALNTQQARLDEKIVAVQATVTRIEAILTKPAR